MERGTIKRWYYLECYVQTKVNNVVEKFVMQRHYFERDIDGVKSHFMRDSIEEDFEVLREAKILPRKSRVDGISF